MESWTKHWADVGGFETEPGSRVDDRTCWVTGCRFRKGGGILKNVKETEDLQVSHVKVLKARGKAWMEGRHLLLGRYQSSFHSLCSPDLQPLG